ncbi:MAG: FHA domain-containing protein [Tannerella sp.]|jgi:pSer/pThr/pTyr-binding forkhead associated (FHA) protein/DNA-directed RNA polymerase subunit RPC12/RpoP|nr:FHA domain-containing protein [Tannerella sp.]
MEQKNEWIIGREGDIKVSDGRVSRRHARVTRGAEGVFIEDLNSTAGTYVNGKLVKRKKIDVHDKVTLGTEYVLDVAGLLAAMPMSDAEFTESFRLLKEVYDTYNRTKIRIQSRSQGKMMLKRSLPMAVPGLLIALVGGRDSSFMIVGTVLSALAVIGGSVWGAKEMEKSPERLWQLDEQFKIDYACPDCKKPFGAHNSWESLRRQGQCPYCRRKFNVK